MSGRYSVNAARAQRLEALGREWEFEIDGEAYALPIELPHEVVRELGDLDASDVAGMLRLLLGPEQYERFQRHRVSVQDVQALVEAYGQESGMFPGEDSASTSS
ncbi:hypothetical protein BTM25_27210 [Actinomadura rubteroloni]|uniref:Uncharacterized protein n=1 Tax=Actinomadura rubteroloni TaxID=1926885 RepID=A0A2P4UG99_9ACTN|nr:hypothetical protein [Actinomadura rubteroloni]POM24094.1 hypothetical protein BTM25_27210 [Actinomadura rubteroloni]